MSEVELIRSLRFRKEREAGWKKLEKLLGQVERHGLPNLSFAEADQLAVLYRQAVNSLSLAREISLDKALLDYLDNLCARSYLTVYAPRESVRGLFFRFVRAGGPQAIRRSWVVILVSGLLMAIGAFVGYWLTISDPSWYYAFVPRGLSGGRGPEASEAFLRSVIYNTDDIKLDQLTAFSSSLFAHNTQISIFAFALGIMAGLPTAFLTFYNGTMVGAFFAIYDAKGLGWDLFGWLSIHGVTELSAIVIAAAGGLRLGSAVLFPGRNSRSFALREAGRDATKLAIVAALMLVVAGVLEGIFRQVVTDVNLRLFIGWGIGVLWLSWFVFVGRGEQR